MIVVLFFLVEVAMWVMRSSSRVVAVGGVSFVVVGMFFLVG